MGRQIFPLVLFPSPTHPNWAVSLRDFGKSLAANWRREIVRLTLAVVLWQCGLRDKEIGLENMLVRNV
ncbi:hypothetical protein NIES25_67130 (plasmid) [Nostoc linckia NIES-25]|nr:hypothetical protein NIES25_67130 [Nostoc linckia NIES-25]